ncbi:MAG TPA: hypothetical protein VNQ76_21035, partial [Planctomicrobium sp.]|nr:hypothetical protein [Planctomicrobium sp.]
MSSIRLRGYRSPWDKQSDDGLICRPTAPSYPGVVKGPEIRTDPRRHAYRVEIKEETQSESFNELVVIDAKEWIKYLASIGANSAVPINETLTSLRNELNKTGLKGKAATRIIDGVEYVIVSGYRGVRKFLGKVKTLSNLKVVDMVISAEKTFRSSIQSFGKSSAVGTAITAVLVSASNVLSAILDDQELLGKELGFTLLADIGKAAISGIASFAAMAIVAAAGAPVAAILAGIVIGVVVTNLLDSYFPTEKIVGAMTEFVDSIIAQWSQHFYRFHNDLMEFLLRGHQLPGSFIP